VVITGLSGWGKSPPPSTPAEGKRFLDSMSPARQFVEQLEKPMSTGADYRPAPIEQRVIAAAVNPLSRQ
jgi:hypothetical protein